MRKLGTSIFLGLSLASCTSVPDQQDLTRVDVRDIVRNIRCETKQAVLAYPKTHWINGIAIAYGFSFQSVENNSATATAEIVVPISGGTFTLGGLKLGTNKTRDVTNTVDLAEPLGNLRDLDCTDARYTRTLRFPILGHLGTAKAIDEFVDFVDLPGVDGGKFVRTLKFKLKYFGGATPSVSIVPVPGHKRDASLDVAADREDEHQLILTVEPPDTVAVKGKRLRLPKAALPGVSSTQRALRRLDAERSLNINKRILDKLDLSP